jgi:hypothetical protein
MKKQIVTLSLFSLLSMACFAQKVQIGFKGGTTLNKISGKTFNEAFSYGYHLGGFFSIGLGKKFALQPEVMINQVNIDTSTSFSNIYKFNKLGTAQLKYLSVPLLLNYKAGKLLTLQAGPQFGILMNKSKTFVDNGRDAFKTGDLSMLGGIQLNISTFKIYGRYIVGLNNINDIDNKDQWKSQSIQLGVGFKL